MADPDGGKRVRPGHSMRYRRTVFDWMFLDRDPESFRKDEEPGPEIQIWLEETFGEDYRQGRLKVAMHPHLKRWALFERHFAPEKGENLYQCIYICSEAALENEDGLPIVPSDYRGNPFLECFSTYVGEYRTFNRKDFEEIEKFNRVKYGVDGAMKNADAHDVEASKERERVYKDKQDDFLDYYWWQAQTDANRDAGCMDKPYFVPDVKVKENPEKYVIVEKEGYRVKAKRGTVWEPIVQNDASSGDFMDENANPRTLDQKSHVEGRETVPEIVIPERVIVDEPAVETTEEKVPVLVKR
jgi:hypothetical protein